MSQRLLFVLPLLQRINGSQIMLIGRDSTYVDNVVTTFRLRLNRGTCIVRSDCRQLVGELENAEARITKPFVFGEGQIAPWMVGFPTIVATPLPMGVISLAYGDEHLSWVPEIDLDRVPCNRCMGPIRPHRSSVACTYCGCTDASQLAWAKLPTIVNMADGAIRPHHANTAPWFS